MQRRWQKARGRDRPLRVGMIHLLPLPGSPRYQGPLDRVFRPALRGARLLLEAGFDGLLIENFGDDPFHKDQVPPITVAAMTALITRVRQEIETEGGFRRPLWGVNVLRNDAGSALAIAGATGADFIRVNVHLGAVATDQGLIEGRAAETLRRRRMIAPEVAIVADAQVKHGRPLANLPLVEEVADLAERGGVDGILLTGSRTGAPPEPDRFAEARRAAGAVPIWAASGVTAENLEHYYGQVDGVIVGSALERAGRAGAAIDRARVRRWVDCFDRLAASARSEREKRRP